MEKYSQDYYIRGYHADIRANLKLTSLLEFLQDMADVHAAKHNFGYDFCKSHNIAWVLTHYHIKIHKLPKWNDTITVTTWPSSLRKVMCRREFMVSHNNEICVSAATQWVTLNLENHRPVGIEKYVPHLETINENCIETSFPKIQEPDELTFQKSYVVMLHNLDVNTHVNNAAYAMWAYEAFDHEWLLNHNLTEIEIQFKGETFHDDTVSVYASFDGTIATQVLRNKEENEVARIRTHWEKL